MSQRIWIQNITLHFVFCLVMSLCFSIAKMKLFCFPKYIYLYLLLSFCYSFLHLYRLKFHCMAATAMHMHFCLLVLWILLLSLVWRYAALSPLIACLTLETFDQCRAKRNPRWLKQYLLNFVFQPYDFLALIPVIEGAGGVITDWKGDKLFWEVSPLSIPTCMAPLL